MKTITKNQRKLYTFIYSQYQEIIDSLPLKSTRSSLKLRKELRDKLIEFDNEVKIAALDNWHNYTIAGNKVEKRIYVQRSN